MNFVCFPKVNVCLDVWVWCLRYKILQARNKKIKNYHSLWLTGNNEFYGESRWVSELLRFTTIFIHNLVDE